MKVSNGSSDPINPDEPNPYPETTSFMEALAALHPKCSLHHYIPVFEINGFIHIDEVKDLQVQELTKEPFNFLYGTALFILSEDNKRVRATDRAAWQAKRGKTLAL